MWDHDCGSLPIADHRGHIIGMVTDRDICMAAYTQGRPLREIRVTVAGSAPVHSVPPDASIAFAYQVMKMHRVRRLPVIDRGGNLVGMVSLGDIVRRARHASGLDVDLDAEQIMSMLAEVCRSSVPHLAAVERAEPQPKRSAMQSGNAESPLAKS
jgi:CBS-domain-containing membrane protein